jgi:hypothetical protein
MYICQECAAALVRPAGAPKSGIVDRFAEPKCEKGHDLVHVQCFWGSCIRGFVLSFVLIFLSRFLPPAVAASNSQAVKYSVAVGVLVLATLSVWFVWYGLRYRGKPEPFVWLSEPAFGRAGGLLVGIVVGLMAVNVTQALLRRF